MDRKTGARKVDVPGPAVIPSTAAASPPAAAAPILVPPMEPSEPQPTTQPGFEARAESRKRPEPAPAAGDKGAASASDRGAASDRDKSRKPKRETPIWTYVAVGFTFGIALLGIYELYGLLGH
ncbi:MAG TPA: hypothetical protein VFG23_08075 [Polyangia bacterium]|nr:hypothetical protein [Polyangia bacterium]